MSDESLQTQGQYRIGEKRIPLHALCGEYWQVLRPDGTHLCTATTIKGAQDLVAELNILLELSQKK